MDIRVAASLTRKRISPNEFWDLAEFLSDALGFSHVDNMLQKIEAGEIVGEKAHRWLGWAQCAAVFAGCGSLEDMKEINHNS